MKTTVENLDPSRIKLTVEVPYEELKPSLDAAYKEIGSQIQVPGFRRGHVPNRVIDQRVGRGAVIQEAVNNKLSDFYRDAITEAERVPMLQPEVDVVRGEPRVTVRFTGSDDAEARGVHARVVEAIGSVAQIEGAWPAIVVGGRSVPIGERP